MNRIDSIVLVGIEKLSHHRQPYGLRALVKACRLADKTISKAIRRLEQRGYVRVRRGLHGVRHEYDILKPSTQTDRIIAMHHLNEKESNVADNYLLRNLAKNHQRH